MKIFDLCICRPVFATVLSFALMFVLGFTINTDPGRRRSAFRLRRAGPVADDVLAAVALFVVPTVYSLLARRKEFVEE
jgi:hypothetical protein